MLLPPPPGPRYELEEALALIWSEVLERETVSVHDFFVIGGHSLLAALASPYPRSLGLDAVPLRKLFEWTTIEGLARVTRELMGKGARKPTIAALDRSRFRAES